MKESLYERLFFTIIVLFAVSGILMPNAYAYLDPGTGSAAFQVIIGTLVGVGITLKIYWVKFRIFFQEKFSKS